MSDQKLSNQKLEKEQTEVINLFLELKKVQENISEQIEALKPQIIEILNKFEKRSLDLGIVVISVGEKIEYIYSEYIRKSEEAIHAMKAFERLSGEAKPVKKSEFPIIRYKPVNKIKKES